jgi:hypothetical protein
MTTVILQSTTIADNNADGIYPSLRTGSVLQQRLTRSLGWDLYQ